MPAQGTMERAAVPRGGVDLAVFLDAGGEHEGEPTVGVEDAGGGVDYALDLKIGFGVVRVPADVGAGA